jgi:hypothetical protein
MAGGFSGQRGTLPNNENLQSHTAMKLVNRISLLLALAAAPLAVQAQSEPGFVDFNSLPAAAGRDFIEVRIDEPLLALAARFAALKDPAAAEIVRSIRKVRVNVVGLDATNQELAAQRIASFRDSLEATGWTSTVTVREAKGAEVNVYIKVGAEEVIEGLVVTVLEAGKEAVLVNVVGNLHPDKIEALARSLNIEPLNRVAGLTGQL